MTSRQARTALLCVQRFSDRSGRTIGAATDADDVVPVGHLDALAAAGLYGRAAPAEAGGMGVGEATARQVIEILDGGRLTTTFVWIQHDRGGASRARSPAGREGRMVGTNEPGPAAARDRRGGHPAGRHRSRLTRSRAGGCCGAWSPGSPAGPGSTCSIPAARNQAGDIVWALVDAAEAPTLSVTRTHLVAVNVSATVMARFRDHFVPAHRVTGVANDQRWQDRDAASLRTNGSLALGVAGRCCRLLGPSRHDDELTECRAELDRATAEIVPAARASASHLAMRTAAALIASAGSRSILMDHHGRRLRREAMFLLVFASRAAIRTDLVYRLERPCR
jgi:hypothetical protein